MQANVSLVLNILLLIGVVFAIGRLMKARRQDVIVEEYPPSVGQNHLNTHHDDIISVRKIPREFAEEPEVGQSVVRGSSQAFRRSVVSPSNSTDAEKRPSLGHQQESAVSVMMFLLAKENRQLAGYELLQTVLAAGLRFGEGHLFHRHQFPNGQGPVLCSLAAATASGVFDLQNIGAFSVHGLCLFMQSSGNSTIDAERFSIMLDTAKQLSEGLDTYLLDDKRQPLSDASIQRYYRLLNLEESCEQV